MPSAYRSEASEALADVDHYFATLTGYRRGDAAAMISYLNRSAAHATAEAAVSAERLSAMPEGWRDRVNPRARSGAAVLIDELTAHPVLDAARAQQVIGRRAPRADEAWIVSPRQASSARRRARHRGRVWVAGDVMDEIEDLDERIGARATPDKRWH